MPNEAVLAEIEFAELIQSVDDGRVATDPFKLPTAYRTDLNTRLVDLKAKDAATLLTEGDRAGASAKVRAALDALAGHLRDGFNFVRGIGSYAISEPDRLSVFTAYGWEQGEIGNLTDARIEALANQAITATPSISDPAWRYPAIEKGDRFNLCEAPFGPFRQIEPVPFFNRANVNANQSRRAGSGTAQAATAARDLALDKLQTMNDRIRFFYCSASDDEDQTPELAKIGKQPRRDRGEAEPEPFPDPAGTASFNAATNELSVAALPAHATSLRAFRQPLGGTAELAGTSTTTTVSVLAAGPLTPGVTYEFWLVGHNLRGDGPESNHVTHAVLVGP